MEHLIAGLRHPALPRQAAATPCDEAGAGRWVLLATILGSSMAFIDSTVVNVALPVMQRDLQASLAAAQWIVEAYGVALSALILVGGSLGDRYGRRRMFTIGIVLFTLASLACGASQNATELVVCRGIQGVGAAMLMPESLAIISACFEGTARGKAIGTWSAFTALTSAAGPVLGGAIVAAGSWRYVFFINLPVALVVLALLRFVPESKSGEAGDPDWLGAALVTLGLGGLVFGLVTASNGGFGQVQVVVALVAAVVLLGAFLTVEARTAAPMLPLRLFGSAGFSGANTLTLLLYAALSGALFFLPFDLIQVQGYPPQAAGAALLPFVLLISVLSRWSGGLIGRYGARWPLTIGPVLVAIGFLLLARNGLGGGYWTTIFPAVVVLGLGMAMVVAPLTTTVMASVDTRHSGLASGVNNAVARLAGVLAIAVLSIFVVMAFDNSLNRRLAGINVSAQVKQGIEAQRDRLAAIQLPEGLDAGARSAVQQAVDLAFVDGFRLAMTIAAGLCLASAACTLLTIERKPRRDAPRPRTLDRSRPDSG